MTKAILCHLMDDDMSRDRHNLAYRINDSVVTLIEQADGYRIVSMNFHDENEVMEVINSIELPMYISLEPKDTYLNDLLRKCGFHCVSFNRQRGEFILVKDWRS